MPRDLYIVVAGYRVQAGGSNGSSCSGRDSIISMWRDFASTAGMSAGIETIKTYVNVSGPGQLSALAASNSLEALARLRLDLASWSCVSEDFWWIGFYKESPYARGRSPEEVLESIKSDSYSYLVAYPMKKDPTWYLEPLEKRRKIMGEHIRIARESSRGREVNSITTYAFGIAGYEFLVIYEINDVAGWIETVEKLREAEARRWVVLEEPVVLGVRVR